MCLPNGTVPIIKLLDFIKKSIFKDVQKILQNEYSDVDFNTSTKSVNLVDVQW